jgi:hypothetical protein
VPDAKTKEEEAPPLEELHDRTPPPQVASPSSDDAQPAIKKQGSVRSGEKKVDEPSSDSGVGRSATSSVADVAAPPPPKVAQSLPPTAERAVPPSVAVVKQDSEPRSGTASSPGTAGKSSAGKSAFGVEQLIKSAVASPVSSSAPEDTLRQRTNVS